MSGEGTDRGIAAWISVADAAAAIPFYEAAFGAVELESDRLDGEDGTPEVAHLQVGSSDFWVQRDPEANPAAVGGRSPVRLILTVPDPDSVFAQAVALGAEVVVPVEEHYGWRIGRIVDPSGHHWEIGRPLPA